MIFDKVNRTCKSKCRHFCWLLTPPFRNKILKINFHLKPDFVDPNMMLQPKSGYLIHNVICLQVLEAGTITMM